MCHSEGINELLIRNDHTQLYIEGYSIYILNNRIDDYYYYYFITEYRID